VLVGTKVDAVPDREDARAALRGVAEREGVGWFEVSAVTGEGLTELVGGMFELAAREEVA